VIDYFALRAYQPAARRVYPGAQSARPARYKRPTRSHRVEERALPRQAWAHALSFWRCG